MPSAAAYRWALISAHVLDWVAVFIVTLLLTPELGVWLIEIASGIALAVYVPATIILGVQNKNSTFCKAIGELVYLSVQFVLTIIYAGYSAAWANTFLCGHNTRVLVDGKLLRIHYTGQRFCPGIIVTTTLSFLQVVVIASWIFLIVYKTRNSPGLAPSQALQYPAHRLVSKDNSLSSLAGDDTARFSLYGAPGRGSTRSGPSTVMDLPPIVAPVRAHDPYSTQEYTDRSPRPSYQGHGRGDSNVSQTGPYLYPGTAANDPFRDRHGSNASISSIGSVRDPREI